MNVRELYCKLSNDQHSTMSGYRLTTSSVICPFYSTEPGLAHARAAQLAYALGAI